MRADLFGCSSLLHCLIPPAQMAKLVNLIHRGVITRATGQQVLSEMFDAGKARLQNFMGRVMDMEEE